MFSLIGAFFYLRVVKVAYFDEPDSDAVEIQSGNGVIPRGLMSLNGLLLLLFGILPGGLMALCIKVVESSLKF
jgi:NADH-quinone oxidoreductase subunit N